MPLAVEELTPNLRARDEIAATSGGNLYSCFQCSVCSGICPWRDFRVFSPRLLIRQAQMGLLELGAEEIWLCTSCGRCEAQCPHKLEIIKVMTAARNHALDYGKGVPNTVISALESIYQHGNPWEGKTQERAFWASDLSIKDISEGGDVLYFVGCTASYDPRSQILARALVEVFQKVQLNFGILGTKERDCGNCAALLGEIDLSGLVKADNIKEIRKHPNISTIVATSPHSYNIILNEYGLDDIEVLHYTQFLLRLINEGDLELLKPIDQTVTFHDPCYLSRHNDIMDEPRELLKAIPGVNFVEMKRNRKESLCCGGGGGRIWQDTKIGERFSIPRAQEAAETGANILATSCYFCLLNFEDAVKQNGLQDSLEVFEIAELVKQAM